MSSQNRMIIVVAALVAVTAGAWFGLLSPKRAELGTLDEQIAQATSRRDVAVTAAREAESTRARYQSDYATVARLGKAVPADDDTASLVYQLETIAKANDIDFRAVKLTGSGAAASTTSSASAAASSEKSDDGKDKDATAPDAQQSPVAPVVAQPPPGAVVGPAGLLTVPFTFTFDGDYLKMQRFLKAIDGLANRKKDRITVRGRLLTVDGFSLAASSKGFPRLKALVSATAYLAPEDATGGAPAASGSAPAGSSSTTAMITPSAQGAGR